MTIQELREKIRPYAEFERSRYPHSLGEIAKQGYEEVYHILLISDDRKVVIDELKRRIESFCPADLQKRPAYQVCLKNLD